METPPAPAKIEPPACPACDTNERMESVGHTWYFCNVCATSVAVNDKGEIVRRVPPRQSA